MTTVVREVLLRRYAGEKCRLCREYPDSGEMATMTITHIPERLFVIRDVCHLCIEALAGAWKKAGENPDSVEGEKLKHSTKEKVR